jgi:hypothetical protein
MNIKHVTTAQMETALATVNASYEGNVIFNRYDVERNGTINFTLRVKDSKAPGHRRSHMGRRIPAACWHVHRDFMAAVFDLAPDAVLRSCRACYKGKDGFERDFPATGFANIGSMMQPLAYADACDC